MADSYDDSHPEYSTLCSCDELAALAAKFMPGYTQPMRSTQLIVLNTRCEGE
jgi:hypothetical protein